MQKCLNFINEITGRKAKGATQIRGNGAEVLTSLDNLKADTVLKSVDEIARLMEDRKLWKSVVNGSREHYPP